jgi:hypothetical protein
MSRAGGVIVSALDDAARREFSIALPVVIGGASVAVGIGGGLYGAAVGPFAAASVLAVVAGLTGGRAP